VILDTNALSAFLAEDQALSAVLENVAELHLPVIVLGEYRFGLANSRLRRVLLPLLDALEADCRVLDMDASTARKYAEIRDELRRAGTPIPENDLWIAALARQHELEVASGDAHFDHVKGVQRKTW
jgi:tRNA(fMet)-specific endonuclease VapC